MTDTLENSENDKISTGFSDILSFDTLNLDAQSFKTVSTKYISEIDKMDITSEEKPSIGGFFKDLKKWLSKDKQRKKENGFNDFLGYYECLNTSELLNKKITLSTARIDLHEGESVVEGKNIVITKIQNVPYIENASLFIITDDSIKNLIDGEPIKGDGTYEVFIKRVYNGENNKDLNEWKENAKNNNNMKYKMALAGYYMKGPKENHNEAKFWYKQAEKLGSLEAKLCLGYMHSIGKLDFDPKKAKVFFKGVINKLEKPKNDEEKELSRIAMRNMALIYHNSHLKRPLEVGNLTEVKNLSDFKVNNLAKIKLKTAFRWYEKSFDLYDSQSAYNLGLLYESDDGIKKDEKQAEYYFRKAIDYDKNNIIAKKKLGNILYNKEDENAKVEGLALLTEVASIGLE
uniref:HCP-like protein n=1 Tax=Rhizophagus irregularis (strain DAOM 181602 / DAOM 197198 / MUCL 43194) TaxID=747089 RepID=U9UJN2_RHIID